MGNQVQTRDGILNFQSLMWNQLSSPVYRDLIRYAWHSTDPDFQTDELDVYKPPTVQQVQFGLKRGDKCQVENCTEHAFIRCSYCGKLLCLDHFLNRTCFHDSPNDFIEGRAQIPGLDLGEPDNTWEDDISDLESDYEFDFDFDADLRSLPPAPSTPGPGGAACPVAG